MQLVTQKLLSDSLAPKTRVGYMHMIDRFITYCDGNGIESTRATSVDVRAFRADLEKRGFPPRTIQVYGTAIGRFLRVHGVWTPAHAEVFQLAKLIGNRKGDIRKNPTRALTLDHVKAAVQALRRRSKLQSARNTVVLLCGFGGGMEPHWLQSWKWKDTIIDETSAQIRVSDDHTVVIARCCGCDNDPVRALERWRRLSLEHGLGNDDDAVIVEVTPGGKIGKTPITHGGLQHIVKRSLQFAGIDTNQIRARSLRLGYLALVGDMGLEDTRFMFHTGFTTALSVAKYNRHQRTKNWKGRKRRRSF